MTPMTLQPAATPAASPVSWVEASTKPAAYEVVMCRQESGFQRLGRWNGFLWQYAEFLHSDSERNKYPPISQTKDPVTAWHAIALPAVVPPAAMDILEDLRAWMADKPAGPKQSVARLIELWTAQAPAQVAANG